MESIMESIIVNPGVLYGIGVINFTTIVSFIINLCSHYRNKRYICYMHLLFWVVFNVTIFLVGILPQINKITRLLGGQ